MGDGGGGDGGDGDAAACEGRRAWRLSFSLPPSVYATMLLRELMHEPLEAEEHTRRAKELAAESRIQR